MTDRAYRSVPALPALRRDGSRIILENEFLRWEHDLTHGGELTAACVKNGSGRNLLTAPQKTSVALLRNGVFHAFRSEVLPAEDFESEERRGAVILRFSSKLADAEGRILPGVLIRHTVEYRQWGYANHHIRLDVSQRLDDVGNLQIGTLFLKGEMDMLMVRPSFANSRNFLQPNSVKGGYELHHGEKYSDYPAWYSRFLPVSALMFEQGVEGIEFALADDLYSWDHVGSDFDGVQQSWISWNSAMKGYEMRFAPLDSTLRGQSLNGIYDFRYRLTLPHIPPRITPLEPFAGRLLKQSCGFRDRWPSREELLRRKQEGFHILSLHDEGNCGSGVYWRNAVYPPYPPDEMKKMEQCLADAVSAGIRVVPYFSVKEYYPAEKDYAANAGTWARLPDARSSLIMNDCGADVYGAQMCLESGWLEKRKATIDEVLSRHPFQGVYYDWCFGLECANPAHSHGRHWDNDKLLELLEWTRERVGDDGIVYLHMTAHPSLAVENIATLVLTDERSAADVSPLMFTPHVSFLNLSPRESCSLLGAGASPEERKRMAMCAVLHHAVIWNYAALDPDFYHEEWMKTLDRYTRHTSPAAGKCRTDVPGTAMSAYWNDEEILLVFANLTEREVRTAWRFSPDQTLLTGEILLPPMRLTVREMRRECMGSQTGSR